MNYEKKRARKKNRIFEVTHPNGYRVPAIIINDKDLKPEDILVFTYILYKMERYYCWNNKLIFSCDSHDSTEETMQAISDFSKVTKNKVINSFKRLNQKGHIVRESHTWVRGINIGNHIKELMPWIQ